MAIFSFALSRFSESIKIPEKVASIGDGAFNRCDKLKEITVSSKNPYFKSDEGVLFNKDGSKLICYPSGKNETSYKVPDYVKFIDNLAFEGC